MPPGFFLVVGNKSVIFTPYLYKLDSQKTPSFQIWKNDDIIKRINEHLEYLDQDENTIELEIT